MLFLFGGLQKLISQTVSLGIHQQATPTVKRDNKNFVQILQHVGLRLSC